MSLFPEEFWNSPQVRPGAKSLLEDIARDGAASAIQRGLVEIINGDYLISYIPRDDGSIPWKAIDKVKSVIDRLHDKFPTVAKRIAVHITRDPITVNGKSSNQIGGLTYLTGEGELSNTITLNENFVNSGTSIGAVERGWFQTRNMWMSISEWIIVHEWGHATDRHLTNPEPEELYNNLLNDPNSGLSRYARYSRDEGYAEAFADWITSKGMTSNPATLAYANFYNWEIP